MVSVNKKNLRNLHARRYIQEVFATRLRDEGFVCPDDKLLCWYRLNSDEIVNSICFFSRWPNLPLMLEIGYGIHPLFVKPYYSSDVYISNPPIDERFYTVDIGFGSEKRHYAPFSPDVLVYTPKTDGKGIDAFERGILPQMNGIMTIEQCYLFHRKNFRSPTFGMSSLMIDEAIIINDSAILENAKRNADKMVSYYFMQSDKYPNEKAYRDKLLHAKLQKAALTGESHEEYLAVVEKSAAKNLLQLQKQGIVR